MSSRFSNQHVKFQEGDYHSYVTKMERMTSTCEGPHFPTNLFKNKEKKEDRRRDTSTVGLFGRAEHRFEDHAEKTEAVCEVEKEEEKDVNSVSGEFIKRRHDRFSMDKLMSIKA